MYSFSTWTTTHHSRYAKSSSGEVLPNAGLGAIESTILLCETSGGMIEISAEDIAPNSAAGPPAEATTKRLTHPERSALHLLSAGGGEATKNGYICRDKNVGQIICLCETSVKRIVAQLYTGRLRSCSE